MNAKENVANNDNLATGFKASANLGDGIKLPSARCDIKHMRPTVDGKYEVVDEETTYNLVTDAGRDFLHQQGYQTSGLGANGLNYIALTNTAITPATGDTSLSGEIVANGLARAQGVVAHTTGTTTTTVAHTFTCTTTPQAAQAAALFTASSSGTMNHEVTFTQRSLQIGDQLAVTFTITLG